MDVREKLVELIEQSGACFDCFPVAGYEKDEIEKIVSHLIAHGVTVQECGNWKYYHKQNKAVCTNCSFERDLDADFGKAITCPNCGAYMPQPPKGE
jgi:hypothetical protein